MSITPKTIPLEAPAMNFTHAMISFKGRLRRQHYFICQLFIVAATVIALAHPFLTLLLIVPVSYCALAVTTKRLHDMEYSGWLILVPFSALIATFIVILLLAILGLNPLANLMNYPYLAFLAGWNLWLICSPGMIGANQYGPDPKLPAPTT